VDLVEHYSFIFNPFWSSVLIDKSTYICLLTYNLKSFKKVQVFECSWAGYARY